ncbi:MAG: chemotaxis protein CheD [Symbiobacteriaceae bacterium]|nr:chemotaxis protein CheD [Symbiobacteriaceae bacterium]
MSKTVIGISDLNIADPPGEGSVITYALGSCIAICLYDSVAKIAGMAHIMLPASKECPTDRNMKKFADTAAVELVRMMEMRGARRVRMKAKIAGGAQMFKVLSDAANIGRRNTQATKDILRSLLIPIVAEDTGDDFGRTVEFFSANGILQVRTAKMGNWEL